MVESPPEAAFIERNRVIMKIYTKTGDLGETGLLRGRRVRKSDLRIEAYGTVDELNAWLGLAVAEPMTADVAELVGTIQHELFDLGAELAVPETADVETRQRRAEQVERLEAQIDRHEASLPPLKQFILPGGTAAAAVLHLARTVCRRAERRVVALADEPAGAVADETLAYLNRLGDLLFVLARRENASSGQSETPWSGPGGSIGRESP